MMKIVFRKALYKLKISDFIIIIEIVRFSKKFIKLKETFKAQRKIRKDHTKYQLNHLNMKRRT